MRKGWKMKNALLILGIGAILANWANAEDKVHFIYHTVFLQKDKATGKVFIDEEMLLKVWDAIKLQGKVVDSALLLELYEVKDFEKAWPLARLPEYHLVERTAMTQGRENILEIVGVFKKYEIPFWFAAYPPMGPAVNPSTLEAIFASAGELCRGIVFGESYNGGTLINPLYWSTALQYLKTVQKYGKKLVWIEHVHDGPITSWPWHYAYGKGWWGLLLYDDLFRKFFNAETADLVVPCTETNDPRGEVFNTMAVLGIWYSGFSNDWGVSVQDWFWHDMATIYRNLNKPWSLNLLSKMGLTGREKTEEMLRAIPPNLVLRQLIAKASMGAKFFEFESAKMPIEVKGKEIVPARQFKEAIKPFAEMLESGIIKIPKKEEILTFSNLAFLLTDKNAWYVDENGLFVGAWERGIFAHRYNPESGEIPPDLFFKNAYKVRYPLGWTITATPYGMILILPKRTPSTVISRFRYVVTTNLRDMWLGDEKVGAETLGKLLEASKEEMPFTAEDFFLSAFNRDGMFYCYVVDPDELEERETVAKIRVGKSLGQLRVRDLVEGRDLGAAHREVEIRLPKERGFAILEFVPVPSK